MARMGKAELRQSVKGEINLLLFFLKERKENKHSYNATVFLPWLAEQAVAGRVAAY